MNLRRFAKILSMENLLFFSIIVFFLFPYSLNKYAEFILLGICILSIIKIIKEKKNIFDMIKREYFIFGIFGFIIILNLISCIVNYNNYFFINSLFSGVIKIIGYTLIFFSIYKNKTNKYNKAIIFSSVLASIFLIIFTLLNLQEMILKNYSNLTVFIAIGIILSMSYLKNLVAKSNIIKKLSFVIIILAIQMLAVFLLANYLTLIIIIIFLLLIIINLIFKNKKIICLFSVLSILIVLIFSLANTHIKNNILNSVLISKPLLYATAELSYNNLFLGVGADNYSNVIVNADKGLYYYTPFKIATVEPNNSALLVLIENGLIVALSTIVLFLYLFYTIIKGKKNIYINLLLYFYIAISILTSNVLSNQKIDLVICIILASILTNDTKQLKPTIKKIVNILFIIVLILTFSFSKVAFDKFKKINDRYSPIMEKDRKSFVTSINNMTRDIDNNLDNYYESSKNITSIEYNAYKKTLLNFHNLIISYVEKENSRYYKTRPFKDLYYFYKDLYIVSNNFSKGSLKTFFELTLPIQIENYSSDKVLLPYYGYTSHCFEEISSLCLTYYINQGFHYNPLAAIRSAEQLLSEGKYDEFKKVHMSIANLMEEKKYNDEIYLIASYNFKFNEYEPPWYSGMAQGVILDITATAYHYTKDKYYYDFAQKIIPAFYIDYTNGGVVYNDPDTGLPFLLEYTYSNKERELNGSIIGAFGLRNWYRASNDEKALELYKNFIQEIIYVLPNYNYNMDELPNDASWSKYSLTVFPVQKSYHKIHLNLLSSLSKDPLIKDLDDVESIDYYLELWKKGYTYFYPNENIKSLFRTDLDSIYNK